MNNIKLKLSCIVNKDRVYLFLRFSDNLLFNAEVKNTDATDKDEEDVQNTDATVMDVEDVKNADAR